MKEKHIYLTLSILLLIALVVTMAFGFSNNTYCLGYIQKIFHLPIVCFFLIGISKQMRDINSLIWISLVVLIQLFSDFGAFFLGEKIDWISILIILGSGIGTYFLRLSIHSFMKK